MTTVDGAWSRDQLTAFLGDALVPLRLGCHTTDGTLWTVSLWFQYDGQFRCATGKRSDVASFLRADEQVSFEVSTNQPPYMGVRGSGTATLSPDEGKETLRGLLERYLGGTDSELAQFLLADDREELLITVEPDRLYTWDFTDRMGGTVADSPAARAGEPRSPKYDTSDEE